MIRARPYRIDFVCMDGCCGICGDGDGEFDPAVFSFPFRTDQTAYRLVAARYPIQLIDKMRANDE